MPSTAKSNRKRGFAALASPRQGIALWRSVADEIERAIAGGKFAAGGRLPAETEIADSFRVNRHTVRRAIADLAERGLVRAERGSGTYVEAARIPYPIGTRTRFSEIVGGAGREASATLIESSEMPADRDIARRLAIDEGDVVIQVETLRSADGIPICVGTSWLSSARFPKAAEIYFAKRSMTRTLAHFGVNDYRRASTHVTAALADLTDATRLGIRPGNPILVVESVDAADSGLPLLTTRARFAAERVELLIDSWTRPASAVAASSGYRSASPTGR